MVSSRSTQWTATCLLSAALLAGCSDPSPSAASAASAVSAASPDLPSAPALPPDHRHRGGPDRSAGSGATVAPGWPSGVPLPGGGSAQVNASPGAWIASMVVAAGLDDARATGTDLYSRAGYALASTAPGLVVLTGASFTVTITLEAADHSPARTQVVVHLAAG